VTHVMLPLLRKSPAGRIVNVSSLHGSLSSPGAFVGQPSMPYSSTKTALNSLTVHYARALADTSIKVNAGVPDFVATDFDNFAGERTPEQGAAIALKLATLDEDGPTDDFFDDSGSLPW
jgi:NAD(P)-dependent dehydrogenase (short-subunit alcohol dehydrogenase family)